MINFGSKNLKKVMFQKLVVHTMFWEKFYFYSNIMFWISQLQNSKFQVSNFNFKIYDQIEAKSGIQVKKDKEAYYHRISSVTIDYEGWPQTKQIYQS